MNRQIHKTEDNTEEVDITLITVEPPIKDPPRKGQPPYKGHSSRSLYHSINTFLTSEKRTTSEIKTEAVSPKCPLFGGSNVYNLLDSRSSVEEA